MKGETEVAETRKKKKNTWKLFQKDISMTTKVGLKIFLSQKITKVAVFLQKVHLFFATMGGRKPENKTNICPILSGYHYI